uniref:Uncharacterized protein n=1 Tax=Rousettus aegyptiacus TaxID=9407 RepID=A0A7J8DI84_ROUAE|nr:hypothetical protein HJG63_008557 [Rousettus aegyptiacus]
MPLTLGSQRSCSLSSSVRGLDRGAQCPGGQRCLWVQGRGSMGPGHLTPGCSTAQNRQGTGWVLHFPSSGSDVSIPHQALPLQKATSLQMSTLLLKTYIQGISSQIHSVTMNTFLKDTLLETI